MFRSKEEIWKMVGEILRSKDADELIRYITNKQYDVIIRCAALDRCMELKSAKGEEQLRNVCGDPEENEDLRAKAFQWLSAPKGPSRTRGAIRTRGQRGAPSEIQPQSQDWREQAAKDSSARVRWLATLKD